MKTLFTLITLTATCQAEPVDLFNGQPDAECRKVRLVPLAGE